MTPMHHDFPAYLSASRRRGGEPSSPLVASWHRGFVASSPAFTLVEMLVSLAILVVALTVVGYVFSVTTRTTTQAAALAEMQAYVREWETQIREDLRYCDPGMGYLVLVGRTVPASRTADDLAALKYYRVLLGDPANAGPNPDYATIAPAEYSDPRADILAFITMRPTVSKAPLAYDDSSQYYPFAAGAPHSPTQMVYGHAAIDRVVQPDPDLPPTWEGNLQHIDQRVDGNNSPSVLPAVQWHLARRATILLDQPLAFNKRSFTPAEFDRILRCWIDPNGPSNVPPGDVATLNWSSFITALNDQNSVGIDLQPYSSQNLQPQTQDAVFGTIYPAGSETNHHIATIVPDPPVALRSNLGVQMLPGCVWFQVEYLMPEDPRNSIYYASPNPLDATLSRRADPPRWTEVEDGETIVFLPDTAENRIRVAASSARRDDYALLVPPGVGGQDTIGNRNIRLWPYAIRVTIRVFDPRGRLEYPIIRSVEHRFD